MAIPSRIAMSLRMLSGYRCNCNKVNRSRDATRAKTRTSRLIAAIVPCMKVKRPIHMHDDCPGFAGELDDWPS
ncbi:MAG TPA: hypothetical protein PLI13_15710, partial [Paracoccus sp. (in: a-proteobacteria)]|nr:hypothetical protein [Paracoccus sp. (in: a-proteobacteria)]